MRVRSQTGRNVCDHSYACLWGAVTPSIDMLPNEEKSVTAAMLFGWETVMTLVLVSTVYAVAIGEPSFGVVGPFAVGLSLFAMVFAGEQSPRATSLHEHLLPSHALML